MNTIAATGHVAGPHGAIDWLSARVISDEPDDTQTPDWLNATETDYWHGLRTAKRRRDWLLGRWAAKQLIRQRVLADTNQQIPLAAIEILRHPDGWPQVRIPPVGKIAPGYTLSISHSHDHACCALIAGENQRLGTDIEFIEPRSAGFITDYLTEIERAFLTAAPADQQVALVNAIWSGKEAALKAIRRGLAEDTRIISCLPHPSRNDGPAWLPMRLIWTQPGNRPELTGWWQQAGNYVMTLATAMIMS